MNEKVLITGADGLLGSHVVRQALKMGYRVRAFIQPGRNTGSLDGLDYECIYGDITNPEDVHRSIIGCDYLIHTAGLTSVWPNKSQKMWQINYEAVVELANDVKKHKIIRFVHIGSASSFGYGTKQVPGDEESTFLGHKFHLDYLDTKKSAQDYLLEQYRTNALPVIILAPTFMIGEFDSTPGAGKMILSVIKHKVPGYSSGGKCVVYAGDVAQAAVNALGMGRLGECYITGGENLTYKEFFDLITTLASVPPIKTYIPTRLAILGGSVLETITKVTHKPPLISRTMAAMAGDTHFYRSEKAKNELNMPQTPVSEAILKTIAYFKQTGSL